MGHRFVCEKLAGVLLAALAFTASPSARAGTLAAAPLGAVVSTGNTTIGNTAAPTGTTVFAGDKVVSEDPALINLNSGSRVEMTKATASFDRNGGTLVMQVDEGLLRFSFNKGEQVQIEAGDYVFTAVGDSGNTGEMGMNRRGQIAMNVLKGAFEVLDTASGKRSELSVSTSFAAMDMTGKGRIAGQTLQDDFLSLEPDSLKGQCVVAGSEAYAISGNTKDTITVNGKWKLKAGEYTYQVVACTQEALTRAGASTEAAKAAVVTSVFGVPPATKTSHTMRNVAIVAGVGGAVAVPVAIKAMGNNEKSPSSR